MPDRGTPINDRPDLALPHHCRPLRCAARVDLVEVTVAVVRTAPARPLPHYGVPRCAGLAAEETRARTRARETPAIRMVAQAARVCGVCPLVGVRDRGVAAGAEDRPPDARRRIHASLVARV